MDTIVCVSKKQKSFSAQSNVVASLELIDIDREMNELQERFLILEKRKEEILSRFSPKCSYFC